MSKKRAVILSRLADSIPVLLRSLLQDDRNAARYLYIDIKLYKTRTWAAYRGVENYLTRL